MNKSNITKTQNTLKLLENALISKHLQYNKGKDIGMENYLFQKNLKNIIVLLEDIKTEV